MTQERNGQHDRHTKVADARPPEVLEEPQLAQLRGGAARKGPQGKVTRFKVGAALPSTIN